MDQTEQTGGRRVTDYPEQRFASALRQVDNLGLKAFFAVLIALLVIICLSVAIAAGVWFYVDQKDERAFRDKQFDQQSTYAKEMLTVVSAIQAELKQKNELYAKDRRENQRTFRDIINRLSRLEAVYMDMGILPVYKDEKTGRTYIQRQQDRDDLYK